MVSVDKAIEIAKTIYTIKALKPSSKDRQHAMRNKNAQDLNNSMGSTLSSISVYSQLAKIYQEQKRSAELCSVLYRISETSTGMISDMNDILWSLQPANDDMTKIINRMGFVNLIKKLFHKYKY